MENIVNYNKEEVLHSLECIFSNDDMRRKFRENYPTDYEVTKTSIDADMVKPEVIENILRIAPTCYEINDKLFLKGEVSDNRHDFIGDDMDYVNATEIYDMSTEMETGNSYTFYVSDTSYFKLASFKDMKKIKDYLDSIK